MDLQDNVLIINDLNISFLSAQKSSKVVKNLSFSLQKGTTLGIVGESGSGKSVTALSIMQLLPSKKVKIEGEILFSDAGKTIDLLSLSDKTMQYYRGNRLSMIFQEPMTSLNPSLTCGEQISETLRLHLKMSKLQAKKRSFELLEEVNLSPPQKFYQSYPHQLSGGQKQRIMIAIAIACQPDILIADEPTTALDVTVAKNILLLLKDLQKKYGISIIFITHDLEIVKNTADHVLVLYQGEKVEYEHSETLFSTPQQSYTQGLLSCKVPQSNIRTQPLPTVNDFLNKDKNISQITLKTTISSTQWLEIAKKITQKEPLLQVKNLSKIYPVGTQWLGRKVYFEALKSISFDVYENETLGLVGESGCGKTTLGRTLLRLIEPTKGNIFYKGKDICALNNRQLRNLRKEIQIVYQDPYSSLNARQLIGESLVQPMKLHHIGTSDKQRKDKAVELLEKTGLEAKHFYAYPHEFSGGQRQRICIARALSVEPQFVICDEAVSALDISVQAQILNLLNELKKDYHLTYIFISHDLSVVRYMSHRVMVIKSGQIQEINFADPLYENPQNDYTKQLINSLSR